MSSSIMFLLGAGASHGAGVSGIDRMTEKFIDERFLKILIKGYCNNQGFTPDEFIRYVDLGPKVIKILKNGIERGGNRFDIESLLEALVQLEKQNHVLFSILNYPDIYKNYSDLFPDLKNILMDFIRKECEKMSRERVNYLYPLIAFKPKESALDIFTLNYDGTIETMCKLNNVSFTDGFKEEWNPLFFEDENLDIKLYKLHGSLYWFKTETGNYIKLPIKNVEIEKIRYFMDEKISETLIWPMVTKDISVGPFPWLLEKFRQSLLKCDHCFILGYSLRDEYIKKIIVEQMQTNPRLWLFILDHNANQIKRDLCLEFPDFKQRIIIMNMHIEEALLNRIFINKKKIIEIAREGEQANIGTLLTNQTINVLEWENLFNLYRDIHHFDRIQYLVKYILENFQSDILTIPSLQWKVFDLSLRFGIESYVELEYDNCFFWLNIFNECCNVLDWSVGSGLPEEDQIISVEKLPNWVEENRQDSYRGHFNIKEQLNESILYCMSIKTLNEEFLNILKKLLKSIDGYHKYISRGHEARKKWINSLRKNDDAWSPLSKKLFSIVKNS